MRVVIIGAGYVGCVSGACMAKLGHEVTVVDIDTFKVGELQAGRSPVLEPGLDELVKDMAAAGRLKATLPNDAVFQQAEVAVVCVSTPSLKAGGVDTRPMQRAINALAKSMAGQPLTVVVRSTIAPSRLRSLMKELPKTMRVVVNPEFLREATAIKDFEKPPFVLIGGDDAEAVETAAALYQGMDVALHKVSIESALLVKYASNAYHAVKISFANEMGAIASSMGADPVAVMKLFCEDRILNVSPAYLRPGFAFGGSCLPKDVRALVALGRECAEPLPMMRGVLESNRERIDRAAQNIVASGVRHVAMIGLSFKLNSDDMRESPYLLLASQLGAQGIALKIYDPDVDVHRLVGASRAYATELLPTLMQLLVKTPEEAFEGAEAVVLCKRLLRKPLPPKLKRFDLEYLA